MASVDIEQPSISMTEHESGAHDAPQGIDANDNGAPASTDEPEFTQDRKIYIGGLPKNTEQRDLHDCFSDFGPVLSVQLKQGFGFVVCIYVQNLVFSCLGPVYTLCSKLSLLSLFFLSCASLGL